MKFLDANGLALFTKKIFSKFVSNITGADNKITITKGDGTTNEINLNEVVKTDVIGEDPPDDDNSNKIASTRWVQKFVTTMVFKLISKLAGTEETGVSSSGSFLGVNWLIAQNGYICLGKLFGGLIIQWGSCGNIVYHGENVISSNFKLPITLSTFFGGIVTHNYSGYTTSGIYLARISKTTGATNVSEFDVHYKDMLTNYYYGPMFVVVIGK